MKYTNQVEINLPRATVVALFQNTDNYPKWQKGLLSYEPLNGTPGKKGAQAKLRFDKGKRIIEMVETIEENALPDKISVIYMTRDTCNTQINIFKQVEAHKTIYITQNEFIFAGYMKIIGLLFSHAFKRQTQKYLEQFKKFAEAEGEMQKRSVTNV